MVIWSITILTIVIININIYFLFGFKVGMYNNISFTSTIRPVTVPQYKQEVLAFDKPRFARFPWTINEAVIGENVVTTDVMDCSVCGIKVKDKVFLLHTSPVQDINKDFNRIKVVNIVVYLIE